MAIYKYILLI